MKIFGNWALLVPAFYISFVIVLVAFVIWSSYQKVELVDKNYYDKDLVYQQHIDKVDRTNNLTENMFISSAENNIIIRFPSNFGKEKITGKINLFRPSSSALDVAFEVKPDSTGIQMIESTKLAKGLWKIKIDWNVNNTSYYNEQSIVLN